MADALPTVGKKGRALTIAIAIVALLLLGARLVVLFLTGLRPPSALPLDPGISLDNFATIFSSPRMVTVLVNTAIYGAGALILAIIMPLGFLTMGVAILTLSPEIRPLMPALQSSWLVYDVITSFLGYAACAVSFGVSLVYLLKKTGREGTSLLPNHKALETINYKAIIVGFLLFTVGILTGAIWANYAWGTYWSWDPKETWSLITWVVYAILLHSRYTGRVAGRRLAYVSITGFVAVLFTYWGVNYLLSGLHSYTS